MVTTILSKNLKKLTFFATVLVVSLVLGNFVFAVWTEPKNTPPDGNASAPINVSTTDQEKPARLDVSSLYDFDNTNYYINPSEPTISGLFAGKVGIGTIDPRAKLEVNGGLKISGTTEGIGTAPDYAGLYLSSADIIVGGGVDAKFALRHIDVAGKNNVIMIGNQNTAGAANGPSAMKIDTEHYRIGIGSFKYGEYPEAALHVKGDEVLIEAADSAEINFIPFNNAVDAAPNWRIGTVTSGALVFTSIPSPSWNSGGFDAVYITTGNNVGIGKQPDYRLDVNGTIKGTDYRSGDGSLGLTTSVIVKGSTGVDCTLTFKDGLLTAETCP